MTITSPHKVGAKPTNDDDDDQSPNNSGSTKGTKGTEEKDDHLPDKDDIHYSNICIYDKLQLAGPQNASRIDDAGTPADVSGMVHHDEEEDTEFQKN